MLAKRATSSFGYTKDNTLKQQLPNSALCTA
jgi:hypothetical protein